MNTNFTARQIPQDITDDLQNGGVSYLLSRLFAARGVSKIDQTKSTLDKMLSPYGLKGAKFAGELIAKAIIENQKINIVADYDCDGASACAIMVRGLKLLGAKEEMVSYLVPDRQKDGYGLTPNIVDRVKDIFNPDVLITVDNGIASFEGVKYAMELGMKVVVTDHHLPALVNGEIQVPKASVIVNACQPGCSFESKALCGAGAAFYTILMVRAALREMKVFTSNNQPKVDGLLQLVALATVADVVNLDENNRCLIANGLMRIRSDEGYAGIHALFEVMGRKPGKATSTDLGFTIGPRINAAGRMSDMTIGIETLLTDDKVRAKELATKLHEINRERRSVEETMMNDAQKMIDDFQGENEIDAPQSAIVIYENDFHEGVVGLIAGKIKETHHRPTFVFAKAHSGDLKGSGRSIPGFHLRDALDLITKRHPDLIIKFGGHSMAAGCTIKPDGIELFRSALKEIASEWLTEDMLKHTVMTDGPLPREYFTVSTVEELDQIVWGQGFEAPIFVDQAIVTEQKLVGDKHLKLVILVNGQRRDGIWFGRTEFMNQDEMATFAYRLGINEWNGKKSVQIIIDGLAENIQPVQQDRHLNYQTQRNI